MHFLSKTKCAHKARRILRIISIIIAGVCAVGCHQADTNQYIEKNESGELFKIIEQTDKTSNRRDIKTWVLEYNQDCRISVSLTRWTNHVNHDSILIGSRPKLCRRDMDFTNEEILKLVQTTFNLAEKENNIKLARLNIDSFLVPSFQKDIMPVLLKLSSETPEQEIVHSESDGFRIIDILAEPLSENDLVLKICDISMTHGHNCLTKAAGIIVSFDYDIKNYSDITADFHRVLSDTQSNFVVICYDIEGASCLHN